MDKDTTLHRLAREMFEQEGQVERAVAKMVAAIEADQALYRAIAGPAIKMAAAAAVHQVAGNQRRAIESSHAQPTSTTVGGYRRYAESGGWMDYPVAGRALGDLTQRDIVENVANRTKALASERLTLRWLAAVASELSCAGAQVKAELKEADLSRIRRKVERESDLLKIDTLTTRVAPAPDSRTEIVS